MKKNKKIIILLILVCLLSGCTKTLKDKDKKAVVNEKTGQNLTENILCRPTEKESIKLYEENGIDLDKIFLTCLFNLFRLTALQVCLETDIPNLYLFKSLGL